MVSTKDAELGRRALNRLEKEQNITLQQLSEECQSIISVKLDSITIEEEGVAHIRKVRSNKKYYFPNSQAKAKHNYPEKSQKKPDLPRYQCQRCGELHWQNDSPYGSWKCDMCRRNGHKASHCRPKGPCRSYVKTTRNQAEDENVRKYVTVKIGDKDVRLQRDSDSDLSIINHHTCCKIGKQRMMRTKKVARSVTGERIRFEGEVTSNVTLKETTLKLKMFVLRDTNNLRTG